MMKMRINFWKNWKGKSGKPRLTGNSRRTDGMLLIELRWRPNTLTFGTSCKLWMIRSLFSGACTMRKWHWMRSISSSGRRRQLRGKKRRRGKPKLMLWSLKRRWTSWNWPLNPTFKISCRTRSSLLCLRIRIRGRVLQSWRQRIKLSWKWLQVWDEREVLNSWQVSLWLNLKWKRFWEKWTTRMKVIKIKILNLATNKVAWAPKTLR